jgi:hypothetical protein
MKPSHFQTPRTSNECTYWMGGDPYDDHPRQPLSFGKWAVFGVVVLIALSLIAGVK